MAVNYVSAEEIKKPVPVKEIEQTNKIYKSSVEAPKPAALPIQTKTNTSLKEKIKSGYQRIFFKTDIQDKKPAPALNATYKDKLQKEMEMKRETERKNKKTQMQEEGNLLRKKEAAEKKGLGQERVQVQKKVLNTFVARMGNYVKNVSQRFYALLKRESQIKGRIETRIIKLAEKGLDMTTATLAIESAGESLETIKGQVETMRSETKDALESSETNARELFADFRQQTFLLKKEIRNIHIQLVQSVKAMREAVLKNEENKEESPETEEQAD